MVVIKLFLFSTKTVHELCARRALCIINTYLSSPDQPVCFWLVFQIYGSKSVFKFLIKFDFRVHLSEGGVGFELWWLKFACTCVFCDLFAKQRLFAIFLCVVT